MMYYTVIITYSFLKITKRLTIVNLLFVKEYLLGIPLLYIYPIYFLIMLILIMVLMFAMMCVVFHQFYHLTNLYLCAHLLFFREQFHRLPPVVLNQVLLFALILLLVELTLNLSIPMLLHLLVI